jgi:hemerythrin-like metal-binding protein
MPFITWSDRLSVGIESIDNQHKNLVEIINDLNDAMEANAADEIMQGIFERLTRYTVEHFAFEEELFDQYGYKGSAAHKAQHEALIATVIALKDKMESGSNRLGIEVMEFLKRWLTDHILKTDMDYAKQLVAKGVK